MPHILQNPWRGQGLGLEAPMPCDDAQPVLDLLARCSAHAPTPLIPLEQVARQAGVAQVWAKDERNRMGLGSFKALGAAHVIAREAVAAGDDLAGGDLTRALEGRSYVTASAGNHGMSVAAGAALFGARAIIYLAETVPSGFADRLRAKGADVVVEGADYEASMASASAAAQARGWTLLSDGSWPGYTEIPYRVMEGYLVLAAEAADHMPQPPTHILLQAGVGGLAGAAAALFRARWGDAPQIIVVEPDAAPALMESIRAGHVVETSGPVSAMGRLDCKVPSLIALNGLARDADVFVTISETEATDGIAQLAEHGVATSASGGAGLAALVAGLDLDETARVLTVLSEGPTDD
ncbi:MAG: pyridoxal-phosphate dependent enzyme [Pelagimonas sp.]|nr:pyridoxal-phosphate dependent enzyme [Pelagimonas sp.]